MGARVPQTKKPKKSEKKNKMFKRGQKKIRFYFGVGVAYNVVLPSTSLYLISQKYFHYIYSK